MHTFGYSDRFRIFHHGDVEGDCIIQDNQPDPNDAKQNDEKSTRIRVPVEMLLEFAQMWAERQLESHIQDLTQEELLLLLPLLRKIRKE